MIAMIIRELAYNDFFKEYINLLNKLRNVEHYNYETFLNILSNIKNNKNHKIFVIENNNIICGTITLLIETKFIYGGKSLGHIEDLVVHEKYRNSGLGTQLIDYCIDYAKNNNCKKVALCSRIDAQNFYEKKNFKTIGMYYAQYFE